MIEKTRGKTLILAALASVAAGILADINEGLASLPDEIAKLADSKEKQQS
jgi:hypothetical protein